MIRAFIESFFRAWAWFAVATLFLVAYTFMGLYWWNTDVPVSDGTCNIGVLTIQGEIVPYSTYSVDEFGEYVYDLGSPEYVRSEIDRMQSDNLIRGILIRVDSHGGSPSGGREIAEYIAHATLPTVAYVGDRALSAGYMVAAAADTLIGNAFSDIGSIGITASYLDETKKNEYEGYTYVPLVSAPHKDYLTPYRELTAEERDLIARDLSIWHDAFIDLVAEYRSLSREAVEKLANGTSMPATLAEKEGLIDSVGSIQSVRSSFANILGISENDVVYCG